MADEQQFIENGIQRSQIDEFFSEELGRAGYGGMEVAKTPMGTQIVLKAEKPGMVIGKGGKNIRSITTELEERFNLDDPQIDVQEVEEPDLNAQIVADRLANALERGWYFRKAGHTTLERIIDAGALGAEIVLSGKVTGARGRVEKFNEGYIKHNGEPADEIVDRGKSVAVMKLGTIGVNVKIIPPNAELPDDFRIRDDVDTSDLAPEPETGEGVEELLEEPDDEDLEELEAAAAEADADASAGGAEPDIETEEPAEVDEEVVEAAIEEEVAEEAADADVDADDADTDADADAGSADAGSADVDEDEVEAIMAEMEAEIDDEEGDD
ncbi:MAG: 30S ribosomal protein S3 [Halobacteriales archaeon]|nr:30S ribosomal protein S3 [Halobacteriales archaeon]